MKNLFLALFCSLLLTSCATTQQPTITIKEPLEEIHEAEPVIQEQGSLWQHSNRSMFSDRKAQNVGDIVTVLISESASASKEASTSTDRTTSMSAAIPNFFGLENASIFSGDDPDVDLNNLVNAEFGNDFDGNGSTSRKEDLVASLTTQVVGRYPNGQLKIRGGKEVMVNNEVQIIYLTGIIRPVDITAANTVSSEKILNARISYTGKGAISDKQKPGWAMRILDNAWPF
ncbi:MAG: flagellar biosynthesis protein FlgH [Desulfovibrionaceae bacterium]|jgi:flagellar L-ring protein precursor FlgH|nr:flagellar biosynthesis protein FlgH [Desulfovibrionaceae bacterium]